MDRLGEDEEVAGEGSEGRVGEERARHAENSIYIEGGATVLLLARGGREDEERVEGRRDARQEGIAAVELVGRADGSKERGYTRRVLRYLNVQKREGVQRG